jgi:hypothetical protein
VIPGPTDDQRVGTRRAQVAVDEIGRPGHREARGRGAPRLAAPLGAFDAIGAHQPLDAVAADLAAGALEREPSGTCSRNGELYSDLGPDYYRRRDPARTTKRLVAQLEALGHNVTLQEAAASGANGFPLSSGLAQPIRRLADAGAGSASDDRGDVRCDRVLA